MTNKVNGHLMEWAENNLQSFQSQPMTLFHTILNFMSALYLFEITAFV